MFESLTRDVIANKAIDLPLCPGLDRYCSEILFLWLGGWPNWLMF